MKTTKWFYAAQEQVEKKLDQFYKKERQCIFQQVTKDRVTEFYNVMKAGNEQSFCTVCIFKVPGGFRVMIYDSTFITNIN